MQHIHTRTYVYKHAHVHVHTQTHQIVTEKLKNIKMTHKSAMAWESAREAVRHDGDSDDSSVKSKALNSHRETPRNPRSQHTTTLCV